MQVIIFNKAAFNWQRNKRMERWYYCSLHYDECVSHFSLSLPNNAYAYFALFSSCTKVQPKNVSQYPPKSQTMNTTCLTLILVSMLVANATASLAFPQTPVTWTQVNPPSKPIVINCRQAAEPASVDITMTEVTDGVWELNVKATPGCTMETMESRKDTGYNLQKLQLPIIDPYVFENVSLLVLIPDAPHWMVVASN